MKYALIALLATGLFSCVSSDSSNTSESTEVSISGTIDGADSVNIKLWYVPVFGEAEELDAFMIMGDGAFQFSTVVEAPSQYRITIGRSRADLFLHPGDNLEVTADMEDLQGTWLFKGQGSDVANYLSDQVRSDETYMATLETDNIYKLDEAEFTEAVFGMHDMQNEMLNKRFSDAFPSKEFEEFASYNIMGKWGSLMGNYPDYHKYYAGLEEFEVSDAFRESQSKVTLSDKTGLIAPEYRAFARGSAAKQMDEFMTADTTLQNDWPVAFVKFYQTLKASDQMDDGIKEYLLGNHVNDYITYFGTDGVEPILEDFKSLNTSPEYDTVIDANYAKWSKLAKGQVAPTFAYQDPAGNTIGLADMKGKVVYVDIWATWCGPCKGEIPASKELKQKFASREDVVFMYVSVDDNQDAWQNFLQNDPEFKGVHIITGSGWKSDITDSYMISGIPRYLLIDQQGLIVTASAPRPSSGEKIEGMIRGLLDENPSGD